MIRFMALASAAALGLGSMAVAQDNMVDKLRVSVSPDAAAEFTKTVWPDLESDLQTVLDAKFASIRGDGGLDVDVKVIEVSVEGSRIMSEEEELNRLAGWVFMREQGGAGDAKPVKVVIDAKTGAVYRDPDGMVVIPDADLFYTSMLNSFADKTLDVVSGQ